jgi:hypothetical protein
VKCEQALQLIGELDHDDLGRRYRLRLHLLICRHCRRYLSSYRATIQAAKDAFRAHAGPDADEEIPDDQVAAILKAARSA